LADPEETKARNTKIQSTCKLTRKQNTENAVPNKT